MQSAMKVKTLTAFVSCVDFLTKLFKKTKENGIGCGKFARMAFEFVVASSIFGVTFIWPYHCVKSVQIRSYLWSVFSFIRTEYRKIRTRNNSVFGHFSRSVYFSVFILARVPPSSVLIMILSSLITNCLKYSSFPVVEFSLDRVICSSFVSLTISYHCSVSIQSENIRKSIAHCSLAKVVIVL